MRYGSIDEMFKGHEKIPAPWPSAPSTKVQRLGYDPQKVREQAPEAPLEQVDPEPLHSSQPWILKQHVEYYSTDHYKQTGETASDKGSDLNKFPTVYDRKDGKRVIVSGHHRAAAALLQGQQFPARVVRE